MVLRILPLWIAYLSICQISTMLLKILSGFGFYGQADTFDAVMRFVEFIIMFSAIYFFDFSAGQAAMAMLSGGIANLLLVFLFFRANAPWVRIALRPKIVILQALLRKISSMLMLSMAYNQLLIQGVRIVIGYCYSMQAAGAFNVMHAVSRIIRIPVEIGVTVFRVEFAFMHGSGQMQRLRSLFVFTNQIAITITVGGVICMLLFSNALIALFSKNVVTVDNAVFLPLLLSIAFEGFSFPFYTYLLAIGYARPAAIALIGSLSVSYTAICLFPNTFGLPGVAISIASSTFLFVVALVVTTFNLIGMSLREFLMDLATVPSDFTTSLKEEISQ